MIKLKKLLLIHWQAYDFQLVEFDDITLITGQTGVGKSTIIDALNIILLGEKQKHIFNKAANENSDRTLESYLYGKLGDDGSDGFFYLREDNFTSYLVAEFENESTGEIFCCGFVADCYSDHSRPNTQWLIINSGLPDDDFLDREEKIPYSINELLHRNDLKGESEKITLIATDKDYRKRIAGLFGQIRDDYRRLLKQSVSFIPVKDIKLFLTDFVSETESTINVEEMQKSIRRYSDLEQESERIKRKVMKLENIKSELDSLEKRKNTALRQKYYIEKAKLENLKEQEQSHHNEVQQNKEKIESNTKNSKYYLDKINDMVLDKKILQQQRDSLLVLKDKFYLKNKIEHAEILFGDIRKQTEIGQATISATKEFIQKVKALPIEFSFTEDCNQIYEEYKKEQNLIINFVKANNLVGQLVKKIDDYKRSVHNREKFLEDELASLSKERHALKQGTKRVPGKIRVFKEGLQNYLSEMDKKIKVEYLSDVIEFKHGEEKWQQAIESYLGWQRYYLVVDPKYYDEALQYYQSIQKQGEVYGIGIINLGELKEERFRAEKNSLASKLRTSDPLIETYIHFLLGRVIACDSIMSLANHSTSITVDGFLYKGYVTRKLSFENLMMSIGSTAIEKQLVEIQEKYLKCEVQLHKIKSETRLLRKIGEYQKSDPHSCEIVIEYADGLKLDKKKDELVALKNRLNNLDDSELIELDSKITQIEQEITRLTTKSVELNEDSKKRKEEINHINQVLIPELIEQIIIQEKHLKAEFDGCSQLLSFKEAYRIAINKLDKLLYQNFITNYENNKKQTQASISELEDAIRSAMSDYNQTFSENLPLNLNQSAIYLEEYEKFLSSDLPKFELEIKDAKEKAIHEFRYEFLGRLKSNIENLHRQVDEINAALKSRKFGEDTYRFKITPSNSYKKYYEMIMDEMLMDQGEWNLLSAAFESKYAQQIELLFNLLAGGDVEEGSKENRIQIYSDYKTYLNFDMTVQKGDVVQHLSKTYTQKSGGETQIPLYISLLAAFSQVYRIHDSRRNNTIRLIIMDEAFNKIDGEKIKQCIQMIRSFGLQAIFSTPPEKISEIMDEADRALVVFRHQNQALLREFSSLEELVGEPYEV